MVATCINNPRYSNRYLGAQEDRWRPLYTGHRRRFFRAYRCCAYSALSVRPRALFAILFPLISLLLHKTSVGWMGPHRLLVARARICSTSEYLLHVCVTSSLGESFNHIGVLGVFLGCILAPLLVPHTARSLLSEHPVPFALLPSPVCCAARSRSLAASHSVPSLRPPALLASTLHTFARRRLALRFSSKRPHAP
ncbi:hypothetical protein B0H11DRAFT_2126007 [Mycena galericulata]|nr:hypothetical protein B0H11DRAFT_2126007 [Mycena galericulata]